ncbi:MAG: hypothetical protein WDO19_19655 [Bacteroidota bacterium]
MSFLLISRYSLIELLGRLKKAYNIPSANFIGHGDIAPGRKVDPNWRFPWHTLADNGFGVWFADTTNMQMPENFDHLQALRVIGYDMKDTSAVIASFKRHGCRIQQLVSILINIKYCTR